MTVPHTDPGTTIHIKGHETYPYHPTPPGYSHLAYCKTCNTFVGVLAGEIDKLVIEAHFEE